jgi:mannosyl-3-phosphoglycerate phosphatase
MHFRKPDYPLLVYTDLDGTLLDHDTYSFEAALPALQRLAGLAVPVVPVSSKTLAELAVLRAQLHLQGPCIAENGGLIAIPRGYFENDPALEANGDFLLEFLSPRYPEVLAVLAQLRREHGFQFAGFSDMSERQVAELTGLSEEDAQRARLRLCSEPLEWRDTLEAFGEFSRELERRGFTLLKGGRFFHVLGQTDKARAISRLGHYFAQAGFLDFRTVALGDSPNDSSMLKAADLAVFIRRRDGSWLPLDTRGKQVRTQGIGPCGWNEFFQHYLDTLATGDDSQRTTHG